MCLVICGIWDSRAGGNGRRKGLKILEADSDWFLRSLRRVEDAIPEFTKVMPNQISYGIRAETRIGRLGFWREGFEAGSSGWVELEAEAKKIEKTVPRFW